MKGRRHKNIFCFLLTIFIVSTRGCEIDGVTNWLVPVSANVLDTFRGNIIERTTTNIEAINTITFAEGLNAGPYLDISYADSRLVISTNTAYENYEENETSQSMAVTVSFRCTGGSFRPFVFNINVVDTNNNAPRFIPTDQFLFPVVPPLPPGFTVTGCLNDIIVRDIDLTTQRIDFEIEENPYFEIAYDAASSTVDKEFKAILRTTTLIRNVPEALTFRITATDVDLTGDQPLSTTTTITITADTDFQFPEEPVFSQPFYLANYTVDDTLVLADNIFLVQGQHVNVTFSLQGEYQNYFELSRNGELISLDVVSALPANVLTEQQLILVVRADREHTSGSSATVVIQLPERVNLEFERAHYEGQIEGNSFQIPQLVLTKGYEDGPVSAMIFGEHSAYFTADVQDNIVTVSMTALSENVVNENSFINLEVIASTIYSNATTVVTLKIIKDDNVTPVFNKPIYMGSYSPALGLALEQIVIVQGHDSVLVSVEGDHASYFQVVRNEETINLAVSAIPPEIFGEQQIILSLEATKPRTVGANAAIIISLPAARQLVFEESTYKGTLQDNVLTLETILLEVGYDDNIDFALSGAHATYFSVSNTQNRVSINLIGAVPAGVISENNIIILTLTASGLNAVTTTTSVLLEIIKDDIMTPVFARNIYVGTYEGSSVVIEDINLVQGFDDSVTFMLDGDHAQYFQISGTANNMTLSLLNNVPEGVIFDEKVLLFNILANKALTVGANAAIAITFPPELTESTVLRFTQNTYRGTIDSNTLSADDIVLGTGYEVGTDFFLTGDYSTYFTLTNTNNIVSINLVATLPENIVETNLFIVLELEARRERAISGWTSVVIEIIKPELVQPKFAEAYYRGSYSSGLQFSDEISLLVGYDETVTFGLQGEFSNYFALTQTNNSLSLTNITPLPETVLENNDHLIFTVEAYKPDAFTGRTAVFLSIDRGTDDIIVLRFEQSSYVGVFENNQLQLPTVTLLNNIQGVNFNITGDYASFFTIIREGTDITIGLSNNLPTEVINENTLITLELEASAANTVSGFTSIIIEITKEQIDILVFEEAYYIGEYSVESGLAFENTISLIRGFDESVSFALYGEDGEGFSITETGPNSFTLSVNPAEVQVEGKHHLVFSITASNPGSLPASAAIVISLTDFITGNSLQFAQNYYAGSIEGSTLTLDSIILEGYSAEVAVSITGDYANYFQLTNQSSIFTLQLISELPDEITTSNNVVILTIEAQTQNTRAHATIVLEIVIINEDLDVLLQFEEAYYIGSYSTTTGLLFDNPIRLTQEFSDVQFELQGEQSQWFGLIQNQNSVTLILSRDIPAEVSAINHQLVFLVNAQRSGSIRAQSAIVISLTEGLQPGSDVSFEKVLYEGIVQLGVVQHESITISGYSGTAIELYGEYSSLFVADVTDGVVTIRASGSLVLPYDVTTVILELHVEAARAVLLLTVIQSEVPVVPSVSFSSPSYAVNVDIVQTGLVGRVLATADNGEPIVYSLLLENDHLQARLSINNDGELHLSAPANSGLYTFQVAATTTITQATANATVYLTVEAITVCENDGYVMPPLIVLDRDEEEPHNNLVILDRTAYPDCQFSLTNRWPTNQNWLYVDENGLHMTAIDREHQSIAFMALSQVQVELILSCESDNGIRTKRSQRTDWLGPYDYGNNKWVLADTITFNSRRSVVNLIVNDINDNAPIFIGKGDEPIAVGYPANDLEESILPRSLAELQATDADIGENAAILYWSSENALAVAPTTGFVHVRSGAQLENNQLLVVYATDRNGEGLTGSLQLVVKLLDRKNIAVVTVRGAFLDDEETVLASLKDAVGYDVRTLRSVVVSDDINEKDASRKKRESNTTGASLQLYVYGLVGKEPVGVERLMVDITNNVGATINIIRTVSLEDHLEGSEICVIPGHDTGLLVATIVLSVLLFIVIVLIAIWLFLKWRKDKNYDQFSDENSLASRNDSRGQLPKPDDLAKPRLNIQDLRKSEKRLQDMLNPPAEQTKPTVEPSTSKNVSEPSFETILDLPLPETQRPIVIQSIDKLKDAEDSTDDEFGEVNTTRRKSVVTFNENVEKIIHVEDDPEDTDSESPEYEVHKL